jgi:hypothetical protein
MKFAVSLRRWEKVVSVIYHPSAEQQKDEILRKYPGLHAFVQKLERRVSEKPEDGKMDSILLSSGKNIICRRHAVWLEFFPESYSIGYDQLIALYVVYNKTPIIIRVYFS